MIKVLSSFVYTFACRLLSLAITLIGIAIVAAAIVWITLLVGAGFAVFLLLVMPALLWVVIFG